MATLCKTRTLRQSGGAILTIATFGRIWLWHARVTGEGRDGPGLRRTFERALFASALLKAFCTREQENKLHFICLNTSRMYRYTTCTGDTMLSTLDSLIDDNLTELKQTSHRG
jgi:hypothetical protein